MAEYQYSSLAAHSIRLLRLKPYGSESMKRTEIQCELFQYTLQNPDEGHLYEALSYTWGGSDKPRSISLKKQNFAVTENLHAALVRLRDHSLDRILWVDAICIDQKNLKEQGQQVQLMAKIYSKAARVLVWLGEAADNSEIALERMRIAAANDSPDSLNDKTIQQLVLALLQRPWFQRIWVLQEVAAARHVIVMCGPTEIDGYAFCLGVNWFYKTHGDLENSIRSITYLMRAAIFRPKGIANQSGTASLNIRPLGELIEMFHSHEATNSIDKAYALLGMSSDDPGAAGFLPDYEVPWEEAFKNLIQFILCKQVYIQTWGDEQSAAIKSKGWVLGQVSSVKIDDRHKVNVIFKNLSEHLGCEKEWQPLWTFQASVKHIREGDILCILQGAPKPMIIRLCKDYFTVIRIEVLPEDKSTESKLSKLLLSLTAFPRDFLLIWNWEKSREESQDLGEYETLIQTNNWVSEYSETEMGGYLDKATRLSNVAMILDDLGEFEKAEERYREAIEFYEIAFGEDLQYKRDGKFGRTPLSWAVRNGYNKIVDLLVAKDNIELDLRDRQSNRKPLSLAAQEGYETVVQLLVGSGKVDIDSRDESGRTALLWAATNGHNAVVQVLLATGKVDIDSRDGSGRTALLWATALGHGAVVQLLLATGANIESIDKTGRTPLSWAASEGHGAVLQLLLATDKVDIESIDKTGRTPLSFAAWKGHEAVVQLLLATTKVDIESIDETGRTPLLWAAAGGRINIVQLLFATGNVNPNAKDKCGWTPLSLAAIEGHEAMVRLLLAVYNVDINLKDNTGRTLLSLAAGKGRMVIVRLLLEESKVDMNTKDNQGRTPLWWAILDREWYWGRNGGGGSSGQVQDVIDLLRSSKVWIPTDENGQTPSSWLGHEQARRRAIKRSIER